MRSSLRDLYPRRGAAAALVLIAAAGLLVAALTRPIIYTQRMVFWKDEYTVWAGVLDLWSLREYFLAGTVFLFSMVFPFVKLGALACVWFAPMEEGRRKNLLGWLGVFGKWSMLDVFVVAILIVLIKVGSLAKIEPRSGIYLLGGAIVVSMLAAAWTERMAKNLKAKF